MQGVVIYGTGSPLLVDVEESLHRAKTRIIAGVRNRPAQCYLSNPDLAITPENLTPEIVAQKFVVPLFTPANRQEAVEEAFSLGFVHAMSLIDSTVNTPRLISHGPGFYVNAGCTLGAACIFDSFVLINRTASVGHHCRCGTFVSIGPGAVLAGQVSIGKGSSIGAGSVVMPEIHIGENSVVAAGAVVHRDVADHAMVAGNPARRIASGIPGFGDREVR